VSAFWKHYASVSDEVRHKLIEEGWFGRQVTGPINQQDMPGLAPQAPAQPTHGLYAEVWGREPKPGELYGSAPATPQAATPQAEPPAHQAAPEPDRGHAPEP
jgi:hypothetical protein